MRQPSPSTTHNAGRGSPRDFPYPQGAAALIRAALGGTLMGLANLVPGISGGTMLLAAGIYPAFIEAIARVTTLRIQLRPLLLLGTIAGAAGLSILLLAGPVKQLVLESRWVMYSLFIGLTLGGVPLVWRMVRPFSRGAAIGAGVGLALMLLMVAAPGGSAGSSDASFLLLALSGTAAAGAMILPGVSGGYLLLLLGQYVIILSAIESLRGGMVAVFSDGAALSVLAEPMRVLGPMAIGVLVGVVGVSNLLRLLLDRLEKPTLGALLGLLLGAVVGLWPFQESVPPPSGSREPSASQAQSEDPLTDPALDRERWPVERFRPAAGQVASSLGLIALGLGGTLGIDRLGRRKEDKDPPTSQVG